MNGNEIGVCGTGTTGRAVAIGQSIRTRETKLFPCDVWLTTERIVINARITSCLPAYALHNERTVWNLWRMPHTLGLGHYTIFCCCRYRDIVRSRVITLYLLSYSSDKMGQAEPLQRHTNYEQPHTQKTGSIQSTNRHNYMVKNSPQEYANLKVFIH